MAKNHYGSSDFNSDTKGNKDFSIVTPQDGHTANTEGFRNEPNDRKNTGK